MTPPPYFRREILRFRNGLIAIWIILHAGWVVAQEASSPGPEKIYLQLDNAIYTKDQTIWIKAIVTDAAFHLPSQLSQVLYVDLIGPGERIIDRKSTRLNSSHPSRSRMPSSA